MRAIVGPVEGKKKSSTSGASLLRVPLAAFGCQPLLLLPGVEDCRRFRDVMHRCALGASVPEPRRTSTPGRRSRGARPCDDELMESLDGLRLRLRPVSTRRSFAAARRNERYARPGALPPGPPPLPRWPALAG